MKLTIDDKDVRVPAGSTILDACNELGIDIPTLCHLEGHAPFTSCMVCVVMDTTSGRLLPACSAPAVDGAIIETNSIAVRQARRDVLELLLSDHVGDCEAPCSRVCPADLDIPRLIRLFMTGHLDEAALALKSCAKLPLPCGTTCAVKCERVCRRAKQDGPVAISTIMGHLATLAAASPDAPAVAASQDVIGESQRCMHCDCRKSGSCKLRAYTATYGARRRRYRTGTDLEQARRTMRHKNIIYEPGKCIKCGICVRIAQQARERLGLAFIGRGFDVHVAVPFGEPLEQGLTIAGPDCVEACPTGALAWDED